MREKLIFKADQGILAGRGYVDQEDIVLLENYINL